MNLREVDCLACGVAISQRGRSLCSPLCARALFLQMSARGEPLARATDTDVTCLVCNKQMDRVANHYTRIHGLEPGLPVWKRLAVLGLPAGTRLASGRSRATGSDVAKKMGLGRTLTPGANAHYLEGINDTLRMLKKSPRMKSGAGHYSVARTIEAHRTMDHKYTPRTSGGKTHCLVCHRRLVREHGQRTRR